ncbi:hypothetical protein V2O64_21370 [Verrucomicrobiaceae bacterium 227]
MNPVHFPLVIRGTHQLAGLIHFGTFALGFMLLSRFLSRFEEDDEFPQVLSIQIIPFFAGYLGMTLGKGTDTLLMAALTCGLATIVISVAFLKLRLWGIVIISLLTPILFLGTFTFSVHAQSFIVELLLV